jgi:hypothetical protein
MALACKNDLEGWHGEAQLGSFRSAEQIAQCDTCEQTDGGHSVYLGGFPALRNVAFGATNKASASKADKS